ncbi:hypothetical protein FQY83_17250 [Luteimonas marina]|uniref:Uncharacterized protein n=2 Tax=Luteimonas marina TaxID=488485 RepID=A0A5C5TUF7_9GAMM|nr:hypothetical protein FQY83_17250 [Luteimonas marina]
MAELAEAKEVVEINGSSYKILEFVDNPRTGYQGTLYQHVDSGAIVVAHRGTEFGREPFMDGVIADGGMVFSRVNSQVDDAIMLTRRAREHARNPGEIEDYGRAPEVTVTGHSLGGTLAQVSAHHFDLRGETFNAYGAASLNLRIPEGGDRVLNHVMAVDAVSSSSPHYGQVRVYATPDEITTLRRAGYHDNLVLDVLRPNLPVTASAFSGGSHSMHNYLPVDGNGRPDRSVLSDPVARELADRHRAMIGTYRQEVQAVRGGFTVASRGPVGALQDGADWLRGPLPPGEPAAREERERAEREERRSRSASGVRAVDVFDRSELYRRLYGEEYVQPPLRRREPMTQEPSRAHLGPVKSSQAQSDWVARLVDAAGSKDPKAIEGVMQGLWNSELARLWSANADQHRQVPEAPAAVRAGQWSEQEANPTR